MFLTLSNDQVSQLLRKIMSAVADEIDCDTCLDLIPEYAEAVLANAAGSEGFLVVQAHLDQCSCCNEEFELLLICLKSSD